MKPTIKDVARLADVSISTVSRVMNSPDTVVEDKRIRVQQAIEQLKYQPNALARGLISKKSHTLGVLIPDIKNTYYNGVLRGMEDAAKELGYSLMISNTDRDKNTIIRHLETHYEKQTDGIVFMSDTVYPDYYEVIQRLGLPVVMASAHALEYDIPSVKIDDERAAFDAVDYLIRAGHKHIGMISFPLSDPISGLNRYQGYLRALRTHSLEARKERVVFTEFWYEQGYEATARLLRKNEGLTAIFAASDEFALGAISCLYDHGIDVPGQVSVIGFDNQRFAEMTIPKLTTVAQPLYQIGYRAVHKLNELMQCGRTEPLREYLPHELIIRKSARSIL